MWFQAAECNAVNATLAMGSRGYFFLIDTDGSRRSRVNVAQSAEEKKFFFCVNAASLSIRKKNPLEPRVGLCELTVKFNKQ